ncbi:MAG TPA: TonB-dependent receptor [Bryobacteraceae bacterium]|nr:TonB-dependent receptor [Bryobacteraceae bacterium]
MTALVRLAIVVSLFTGAAFAGEPGNVFGQVEDSSGHSLRDAEVVVQSAATGVRWRVRSGDDGSYEVAGLAAGRYKIMVRMPGFRTVSRVRAVLGSAGLRVDFAMELLSLHEVITVTSGRDAMDPASASSLVVTRNSPGATLPANGGDYRALFDLMPGVVKTPASTSDAGQFTSNGQRPNANVFRIDGVSANTGVGSSSLPGAFPGASLPAMNAIGSTENSVSNETAQSVELRTADFSPEFSNRSGAEALVSTRAGSNLFREELFGHVRDAGWSARDWFANSRGVESPRSSYGRLGAIFGGPLRRNHTFYLLSAEESILSDTAIQLISVPSWDARRNAPDNLKPLLNNFQPPTGPNLGSGEAASLQTLNNTGQLLTLGLRADQSLGSKGNLFFRAVDSPSKSLMNRFNWASGTLGLTVGGTHGIHDLRFNYSRSDLLFGNPGFAYSDAALAMAGLLPGYTLLPDGLLEYRSTSASLTSYLPGLNSNQTIGLSIPGLGQFISGGWGGRTTQHQWETRETYSNTKGRHELRTGADYIGLQPSRGQGTYAVLGVESSLQNLIENQPLAVTVSSTPESGGTVHQVSLFAQDTFRLNEKLSLLYGIRWDLTPPVVTAGQTPAVSGLWTGTEWKGTTYAADINGAAPWPMRWGQVAPRIGLAYRLPLGIVMRAGAGLFHDATLGAAVNPVNGAPFNSWLLSSGGTTGATGTGTTGASLANAPDVDRFLAGFDPALRLPTSYQWRSSVERALGSRGVGSVAYTGSISRNLLGHQAYVDPSSGVVRRVVAETQNTSSYQALQAHYGGSIARNLYGSVSYTWAHSIDDGSQDSSIFLIHPGYQVREARGSSSFDVRHAATAAVSYQVPRTLASAPLPPWLAGWTLSGTFLARKGFPIDILTGDQALGQGFDNIGRPDRVPGAPVWIADPSVATGRRLNPAAFSLPANGAQGTLGRNAIAGNGLAQVDMSLRREFPLPYGISVEAALNLFNVLNHPAFADPVPNLSSPWFGQSTSMQNLMLGSGSPNTGLPPLFQPGGARSVEVSFRVSF